MPPDRTTIIKEMLTALETPRKPLSKWEEQFIESIADQFDTKGYLSERQFEVLDRIYLERMGDQ